MNTDGGVEEQKRPSFAAFDRFHTDAIDRNRRLILAPGVDHAQPPLIAFGTSRPVIFVMQKCFIGSDTGASTQTRRRFRRIAIRMTQVLDLL